VKIIFDTLLLFQLPALYPGKTEEVLYRALECAHNELAHRQDEYHLTYEEVVRWTKIAARKGVALNETARDILDHLNRATGKSFRPVETNLKPIVSLLKNNYTRQDVERVIDNKVAKWSGTDMEDYLRPSTLFRASNFEAYLNEAPAPEVAEKSFAAELDGLLGRAK
jgi:uncharacterized phage protein (TIGR02220 family)